MITISRSSGVRTHRSRVMARNPMANDPETLIRNVPHGNLVPAHPRTQMPIQWRAFTPKAPPTDNATTTPKTIQGCDPTLDHHPASGWTITLPAASWPRATGRSPRRMTRAPASGRFSTISPDAFRSRPHSLR